MQFYLQKGQRYTFEIKTNDFESLFLYTSNQIIPMEKQGDIFKAEDILIEDDASIKKDMDNALLSFWLEEE